MDKYPLLRKCLAVGIILLFIGTCSIPATAQDAEKSVLQTSNASAQKTDISHSLVPRGGFGLSSTIWVTWNASETEEPFEPGGAPRSINLTVTYGTVIGRPIIDKIILLYCLLTHQYVTVTLEVGETPSWCTASLSDSQLRFPITNDLSSQVISLAVAVNEYAPAYVLCTIPINASVDTLRGPFSFLPFINGYDQTCTLCIQPGYLPRIIVTPTSDYINATPGNTSQLPINITNTGNARTIVFMNIVDHPSGSWNIYIPGQVVLEINMSWEINLSVTPPHDFSGTENITITFTPCKADDPTQHGEPVYITIVVICEP